MPPPRCAASDGRSRVTSVISANQRFCLSPAGHLSTAVCCRPLPYAVDPTLRQRAVTTSARSTLRSWFGVCTANADFLRACLGSLAACPLSAATGHIPALGLGISGQWFCRRVRAVAAKQRTTALQFALTARDCRGRHALARWVANPWELMSRRSARRRWTGDL